MGSIPRFSRPALALLLARIFFGGTGIVCSLRPSLTGALVDEVPDGLYPNPAADTAAVLRECGSAGRNSVDGPAHFSLEASVAQDVPRGRSNRAVGEPKRASCDRAKIERCVARGIEFFPGLIP